LIFLELAFDLHLTHDNFQKELVVGLGERDFLGRLSLEGPPVELRRVACIAGEYPGYGTNYRGYANYNAECVGLGGKQRSIVG